MGLNIFPLPYGKKGGWKWQDFQFARLLLEDIKLIFQGKCNTAVMTGRTSGNLFVIDCETKKSFHEHEKLLRDANIRIFAVKTGGRRGGGHFYLRCADGEVANVKPGERDEYEVRGNKCYVLGATSLHPDGGFYEWYQRETPEPPVVHLDQVAYLKLHLVKQTPKPILIAPLMDLCKNTRRFLEVGEIESERNNSLFKAACDFAGNHYPQAIAESHLIPVALRIGLSKYETENTIKSAYSKPRDPSKSQDKDKPPIKPHHKAWAWVHAQEWKGKTGQTDRAVLIACCQRAETANAKGVFRASSREVAELAQITHKTAQKSLKRLVQAGLLVMAGIAADSGAGLYSLGNKTQDDVDEKFFQKCTTACYPTGGGDTGVLSAKNDAFEDKALGKVARILYEGMLTLVGPARGQRLAELFRLSQAQVYRALKKLARYGLVKRILGKGGGYVAVAVDEQYFGEQVAQVAGTLGNGRRRRELHRRDRSRKASEPIYRVRWRDDGIRVDSPLEPEAETLAALSVENGPMHGRWFCQECGQIWCGLGVGLEPPPTCDFCQGTTTWLPLESGTKPILSNMG